MVSVLNTSSSSTMTSVTLSICDVCYDPLHSIPKCLLLVRKNLCCGLRQSVPVLCCRSLAINFLEQRSVKKLFQRIARPKGWMFLFGQEHTRIADAIKLFAYPDGLCQECKKTSALDDRFIKSHVQNGSWSLPPVRIMVETPKN